MANWEWESFEDIINDGQFVITDAGPLSVPIRTFSFARNENLALTLATRAEQEAESAAPVYPLGTVRENNETVTFSNSAGSRIVAHGVDRRSYRRSISGNPALGELKEEWSVHRLEGVMRDDKEPSYVIDWLANMSSAFVWPDNSNETTEVVRTLILSEGPTLKSGRKESSRNHNCVKLQIGGHQMHLCALKESSTEKPRKPGFLLYLGNPPPEFRERIRVCLSFALGVYLVYLGCSSVCEEWKLVSFNAISPYTLGGAAFRLPPMPPSPLGTRFEWDINPAMLSRFAESILAHYTTLKFGSLSWAYWHAACATPHIAPVHFGAAIEALQRRYVRANSAVDTNLVGAEDWNALKAALDIAISGFSAKEEMKVILTNKVRDLNKAPQGLINERVIDRLGIALSETEKRAWKRRNVAAHGSEVDDEGTIQLIREIKLLRVLFHRILLSITKASDSYYDYFTLEHPVRRVPEPVP